MTNHQDATQFSKNKLVYSKIINLKNMCLKGNKIIISGEGVVTFMSTTYNFKSSLK
jgi:Tfp pilus assembly protein PilO